MAVLVIKVGLGMKLLRKYKIIIAVPMLGFFLLNVTVNAAEDTWPIVYEGKGDEITYLTDVGNSESYEVKEGDTLWKIAREKMGSGSSYRELAEANSDLITDPNLILPGMMLQMPARGVGLKGSSGFVYEGCYRYAIPEGWTVGYCSEGEAWANWALMGIWKGDIVCLIQDRDRQMNESTRDWALFCEQIRSYVQENYSDTVSDLDFQYYETEGGEKVYLYSYTYEINLETYGEEGSYRVKVCMGIHLTEHIQAQFLGFADKSQIRDHVLYTAGTFKELGKPQKPIAELTNMAIEPVYSWELSGMFNPFPWIEQYYDGLMREILDIPKEQSLRDKFLQ